MNKKILIIDDDESIRIGFQEILTGQGYEVYVADKAVKARYLAEKYEPDLMILDYYLFNDLSGVDICKYMRKNEKLKHAKMIMITGVLTKQQAQRMLHFGFDKVLIKPIETQHLLDEVRLLLED